MIWKSCIILLSTEKKRVQKNSENVSKSKPTVRDVFRTVTKGKHQVLFGRSSAGVPSLYKPFLDIQGLQIKTLKKKTVNKV